jgi:penicillin G amidase
MQPIGQSGQLLSPHYSDLLARWQRVEYLPMRFEQATIDWAIEGQLVLEPQ